MSRLNRLAQNLFSGWFQLRRRFPPSLLDELTAAIAEGEARHRGEVRIAVESRWSAWEVIHGLVTKQRAIDLFGRLRVWDTEHNNGVLIYVLMAERRIEIVADRGIARHVAVAEWGAICEGMRIAFAAGRWRDGSLQGINAVHALLMRHFPEDGTPRADELSDRPVLL